MSMPREDPSLGCLLLVALFGLMLTMGGGYVASDVAKNFGIQASWGLCSFLIAVLVWVTVEVSG